jgi:hypothetical protein
MNKKLATWLAGVFLVVGMGGCASTVVVKLPPAVDLGRFANIGIIEFSASSGENEDLGLITTQKFIRAVQEAQPGVAILELGTEAKVLRAVKAGQLDFETVKAIGKKYQVGALITGDLVVSPVKPKVDISLEMGAITAKAQVKAALSSKLLETGGGATIWTSSRSGTWTLASASADLGGMAGIGVSDAEKKYQQMVTDLVIAVTRDFSPRFERREVEKK